MAEPSVDRRALLAHPALQDTDPNTRTYRSFIRRGLGNNPTVLAIASNTGANQVVEKIVEGLPPSVNVSVIAHVRDAEVFKNKYGLIEADGVSPAQRIAETKADVGIAGFATEPHAEMAMTVGSEHPTVWIQDSPQSSVAFYRERLPGLIATPDHIFTVNEFGAAQERNALERTGSYNPRAVDIRALGDPRDGKYWETDRDGIRVAVRKHFLGAEERKIILYAGVPGESSPLVMRWIAEASAQTGKERHQLLYGRHPRENGKDEIEKQMRVEAYKNAASPAARYNGLVDASDFDPKTLGITTVSKFDALILGADAFVTSVSSTGDASVRWGVPTGIVLNKGILSGTEVPEFEAPPEVTSGASVEILQPNDMVRFFRGLDNPSYLTTLKQRMSMFEPAKGAREAVVYALLEIANKHRDRRAQTLHT